MGGKALKVVKTRRYKRDEYLLLEKEVLQKLSELFPENVRFDAIKAYRQKESFGDMDIVVENEKNISKKIIDESLEILGVEEIYKNNNVWSINYRDFQVDLIFTEKNFFETILEYFAYNDIGNLLGRVARKQGFKLGQQGLNYVLLNKTSLLKDINVTNSYKDALEFLGYDYSVFEKGFNTLEDIFEYVISSKYFDKKIFALENRNHDARTRDAKRPNYRKFLEYIDGKDFPESEKVDKDEKLKEAFIKFPSFKSEYDYVFEEISYNKEIKSKFNGFIISEETGYKSHDLSFFYVYLNNDIKEKGGKEFLYDLDEESILTLIKVLNRKFLEDVYYRNFAKINNIIKYLSEKYNLSKKGINELKQLFSIDNILRTSFYINQPVSTNVETTTYFANIHTIYEILKKHGVYYVTKEELLENLKLKDKDSLRNYSQVSRLEDIPKYLESLEKGLDRVKNGQKKKKKNDNTKIVSGDLKILKEKFKDSVVLSLDIEMYEDDQSKITEVGYALSVYGKIVKCFHYVVEENEHLLNGKYVPDAKFKYNFGKPVFLKLETIKDLIKNEIKKATFVIGHGVTKDLEILFDKKLENFRKAYNTNNILNFYDPIKYKDQKSLGFSCDVFNIETSNLHNAGNDSYYNMLLLKEAIKYI